MDFYYCFGQKLAEHYRSHSHGLNLCGWRCKTRMLRTKVLSFSGLVLTLSSLLLGSHGLGYETAVLMLQVGGLALILALFFRLWGTNDASNRLDSGGPLYALYDLEDS